MLQAVFKINLLYRQRLSHQVAGPIFPGEVVNDGRVDCVQVSQTYRTLPKPPS